MNCKEKQSQMGVLPGKLLLQSPVGSSPDKSERADLTPDPMERNSNLFLQEVSREPYDQY